MASNQLQQKALNDINLLSEISSHQAATIIYYYIAGLLRIPSSAFQTINQYYESKEDALKHFEIARQWRNSPDRKLVRPSDGFSRLQVAVGQLTGWIEQANQWVEVYKRTQAAAINEALDEAANAATNLIKNPAEGLSDLVTTLTKLMKYLPWILGGIAVLYLAPLAYKAVRK